MRAPSQLLNRIVFALAIAAAVVGMSAPSSAAGLFGGGEKEAEAAPAAGDDPAMVDSSMFKLSWPKFEMPKFAWKGEGKEAAAGGMTAEGNPVSRALDRVADSSKSAANKVRDAWGAAVDKLTPGDSAETQTAKADKPGLWSRMFAPEEPKQSETVQEFLAQERVGTTR